MGGNGRCEVQQVFAVFFSQLSHLVDQAKLSHPELATLCDLPGLPNSSVEFLEISRPHAPLQLLVKSEARFGQLLIDPS